MAVADTGISATHQEFEGIIAYRYNAVRGYGEQSPENANQTTLDREQQFGAIDDTTPKHWHGTSVAGILAGKYTGYAGNAQLMDIQVSRTEDGTASTAVSLQGLAHAAQQGARVFNYSYNGTLTNVANTNAGIQAARDNDVLIVQSAGNGNQMAPALRGTSAIYDQYLIVGALNAAETDRAEFSNYPGDNTSTQARFILAPGENLRTSDQRADNAYTLLSGTSVAAPVVSAAAATLRSLWPHLDAIQVSTLLLVSADRSFSPQYGTYQCGTSGTIDCGLYYYGQGKLDLDAAMQPQGEISITTAADLASINDQTLPTQPFMRLAPAFGDALSNNGILSNVTGFDQLGRDYRVDMTTRVAPAHDPRRDSEHRILQHMRHVGSSPMAQTHLNYHVQANHDADGNPVRMALDWHGERVSLSAYHLSGGQPLPGTPQAELPMLSVNGTHGLADHADSVTGFASRYPVNERLTLVSRYWWATEYSHGISTTPLQHMDSSLIFNLSEQWSLTLGMSRLIEKDRFLGTRGGGALNTDGQHVTHFIKAGIDAWIDDRISLFAEYRQAQGNPSFRDSMLKQIQDMEARQMTMGINIRGEDTQWALVYHEPLRVQTALGEFNIPTGRTPEGLVTFERQTADLAPTGRQRNLELVMRHALSPSRSLQANIVHFQDPGHSSRASDEIAGVITYHMMY
ncbi:S8 family serine peptidase [Ectothiorhodospira shaposhnikovii]|uniref:S8 family serine peptidase n=1 Tax=Ectothiorhodospira shaposhnikovii TaxID=1054 RepID=UPI001905E300